MFKSSEGLFHFVFANQDDFFFTDSFLKLNFRPYLYYCIQENGYERIYSLYKNKDSCFLRAVGNADPENQKKKSNIFSFLKKNNAEEKDYISGCYENSMEISEQECSDAIGEILKFMKKSENTAFVVPIDIFFKLSEKNIEQLEKMAKNNIIVITSTCLSSDNDKYFILNNNERTNIFYHRDNNKYDLFPEIEKFEQREGISKIIFIYDILESAFGERVQYWNRLSYRDVQKIMSYNIVRNKKYPYYPDQLYAAVISLWYGNRKFRNEYSNILSLPENIMRTNKIVYDIIENEKIRPEAMEKILQREQTGDFETILKKWQNTDNLFITKSPNELRIEKSAGGYIFRFNKIFASHSEILPERKNKLLETENFFLMSAYTSRECHHSLPRDFIAGIRNDLRYQQIIDNAYIMLKDTTMWNWWHKYMAEMIIEMFIDFKELEESPLNRLDWGEVTTLCFQVWLKGISEMVTKSSLYSASKEETVINYYNSICAIAKEKNENNMGTFIGNTFENNYGS